MWRRHLVSLLIVCATFFLLGCLSGEAVAQNVKPAFTTLTGQPASPGDLAALFKRTPIPVRLYGLEGPESLSVGDEGRFAASANIDTASLPLRFRWDFGDGTTANSLHARHRFTSPGSYEVTFSMSNDDSEVTDTLIVTVVLPAEDQPEASHVSGGDGIAIRRDRS